MHLLPILLLATGFLLIFAAAIYLVIRRLEKREPYRSFLHLRTKQKLRFFRLLIADPRVPRRVKVLPFLVAAYLVNPVDVIPDFIPVLGYIDDVAIVLGTLAVVLRMTPRAVIDELLAQVDRAA